MDRIKISLPENFIFKTKFVVRITDVNYGGHVGNDCFLSYIQEARVQFLQSFGYSEINVEGVGIIMIDAAIEYKAELFYGDEFEVSVAVDNVSRVGFDLFYLIEKKNNDKVIVVTKAKTGILCFDYAAHKVVPVPVAAIEKFNNM